MKFFIYTLVILSAFNTFASNRILNGTDGQPRIVITSTSDLKEKIKGCTLYNKMAVEAATQSAYLGNDDSDDIRVEGTIVAVGKSTMVGCVGGALTTKPTTLVYKLEDKFVEELRIKYVFASDEIAISEFHRLVGNKIQNLNDYENYEQVLKDFDYAYQQDKEKSRPIAKNTILDDRELANSVDLFETTN